MAPDRITLAPAEPTLVATPEIVRPRTTPDPLEPALRSSGRRVLDIRSLGSRRETDLYLSGLWKTVPWDEAEALTHNLVPHVTGLPITEVRVQPRSADERPIVIVSQQHASGVIIRTIEGPVDEVAGLVTEQLDRGDGLETSLPVRTPPEYLGIGSEIPRRSLRVMTVIGRLPVDTLNALRERLALQ